MLILVLLGGFVWLKGYLRSEEFRQQLGREIGSAVGGRAEVGFLEWQGSRMEVGELSLISAKSGDWKARDLAAEIDLSGFWDKVWIVPKIEIREARSEWDLREKGADKSVTQGSSRKSSGEKKKGANWLPNRTEVHEVLVSDYEGEVRTEAGDYSWDGVSLSCQPRQQFSNIVNLEGGRLQTPHEWASLLRLQTGALALSEEGLEVVASEWTGDDFESLEVTGSLGRESGLSALFEDWDLKTLLPLKWQEIISGRLSGSADWNPEALVGELELKQGVVEGLPFLDRLAAYAGTARLQRLTFEEARAKVRKEEDSWEVRDLELFDEGLLRVEGTVAGQSEALSGQLEVGVPPGLLAHIPGAEEKVFLPGKNGMLWATVNLSGTMKSPKEDLSERMIRAAGERMFEMIPETGLWALRYSGEALDQGTSLLLENQGLVLEEGAKVVEEVLEQGSGVVEEGVKTGFGILNGILGGDE
ncbi:MAG: hypothetical protein ACSHYB_14155 [Roseibacillus sp.]